MWTVGRRIYSTSMVGRKRYEISDDMGNSPTLGSEQHSSNPDAELQDSRGWVVNVKEMSEMLDAEKETRCSMQRNCKRENQRY